MVKNNPICSLSWENDLRVDPIPSPLKPPTDKEHQEHSRLMVNREFYPDKDVFSAVIQADPDDIIQFKEAVAGKRDYHTTPWILCATLDKYIYYYYCVCESYDNRKIDGYKDNDSRTVKEQFPTAVFQKIQDDLHRAKEKRRDIRLYVEKYKDSLEKCYAPKFCYANYYHSLCKNYYIQQNAITQKSSLFFDGLPFFLKDEQNIIPEYKLEDYVENEILTGISLSIEIAAVYLEYRAIFINCNENFIDYAFNAFCEILLPSLVTSRMFFTRNTLARLFFHQVKLEYELEKYEWSYINASEEHKRLQWDKVIHSAISKMRLYMGLQLGVEIFAHKDLCEPGIERKVFHLERVIVDGDKRENNAFDIKIPREQIEESLKHLTDLLEMVSFPVCLPEYMHKPRYGLAVFCNPGHENVRYYLDRIAAQLEKDSFPESIPRSRSEKERVFQIVHKCVLKNIEKYVLVPVKKNDNNEKQ